MKNKTSEKDFINKLFPKDFWFSPSFVIDTFNYYKDKYGFQNFLKHRNSKKLKEMWATSVFILGFEEMTKSMLWLRPCDGETPDTKGIYFTQHAKFKDSNSANLIDIEVTEWDKNTTQKLAERILNKLSLKAYPAHFHLVVHVTKAGGTVVNFDDIVQELNQSDIRISGIWVLSSSFNTTIKDNYSVIWIWPQKARCEFSLHELVEKDRKNKTPQVLEMTLKKRGRDLSELDYIELELPELD